MECYTIDAYIAKFIRLSRFTLALVVIQEDMAHRFQHVLKFGIHKHLSTKPILICLVQPVDMRNCPGNRSTY